MRKIDSILLAFVLSALLTVPAGRSAFAQEGNLKANLDLPFDAAGENEEEEEAPEVIVFYGQQFEADFFCFVADRSSSMQGARWTKLQKEVIKSITGFSDRVQFGIVFIANQVTKFPASGQPADANPGQKGAAIAMISSTPTDHGSCYMKGLTEGLSFAAKSSAKRKVLICLGDGEVSCSATGENPEIVLSAVKARNVMGAKINTIGIAVVSGEQFMKSLAAQNNGTYRRGE